MSLRRRFSRSAPDAPVTASRRRQGGTTGKMRRAKPPNVIGRGPLLDSPGFGVAIVAIVRDEADYLEEWLAFHFALGVDHVFLYDNGSSDGSASLLERYQNHGLVTVVDWPLRGGQLGAYNHALRFFGSSARWLAFFDVDEYLVPLMDDDIPAFLARFIDAADVRVERKEFGYSGHRTPPAGLTIDAYTELANVLDLDPSLPPRVKSIVQPNAVSAVDIHLAFPADVPVDGAATATVEVEVRGVAQLNHYYTRSFEEFEAKRFRGSATGRIDRPAVPFDLPVLGTDTSAQRFAARTEAMLERLRRLEPQPYMYGSQLQLSFFPRPNDLGRFAEFALANTAAGLAEPRRVAATRVRNLYEGIGLVGDLSATGHDPSPGELAGSVHTAVLVEHMRGEIVWDLLQADAVAAIEPVRGTIEAVSGHSVLQLVDGSAELRVGMPPVETLRCYALGFVLASDADLRLETRLETGPEAVERSTREGATVELPASEYLAGIVEIDPNPQSVDGLVVKLHGGAEIATLYDLFVVAYG